MNQFLHLVETLETHIDQIQTDLGADWPDFAAQVQSFAPAFEAAQDETALARAVGKLYMACRVREPVMAILRQTADTSNTGHDRRVPAGGTNQPTEMFVQEVVNHFMSLLTKLKKIEHLNKDQNQGRKDKSR